MGDVFYYGSDVRNVGVTSSVTGPGELVKYGFRYWYAGQWNYEWS
jgi:hypothetical protein